MITPLADRILIKPDAPGSPSDLIHLVRDYTPENTGTVVAVPERCGHTCPECDTRIFTPPSVKVGDTVLFGFDAGQEITIDADRYLLIRDADLIAVFTPEDTHG